MDELIVWGWRAFVGLLFVIIGFWIKRYFNRQDAKELEWEKQGGLVTRNMYFDWCKEQQFKCPACGGFRLLMDWRNGMLDKGGVMTKGEAGEFFGERLCQELDHHRDLMGVELKLIRSEIALVKSDLSKDIIKAIGEMKDDIMEEVKNR